MAFASSQFNNNYRYCKCAISATVHVISLIRLVRSDNEWTATRFAGCNKVLRDNDELQKHLDLCLKETAPVPGESTSGTLGANLCLSRLLIGVVEKQSALLSWGNLTQNARCRLHLIDQDEKRRPPSRSYKRWQQDERARQDTQIGRRREVQGPALLTSRLPLLCLCVISISFVRMRRDTNGISLLPLSPLACPLFRRNGSRVERRRRKEAGESSRGLRLRIIPPCDSLQRQKRSILCLTGVNNLCVPPLASHQAVRTISFMTLAFLVTTLLRPHVFSNERRLPACQRGDVAFIKNSKCVRHSPPVSPRQRAQSSLRRHSTRAPAPLPQVPQAGQCGTLGARHCSSAAALSFSVLPSAVSSHSRRCAPRACPPRATPSWACTSP